MALESPLDRAAAEDCVTLRGNLPKGGAAHRKVWSRELRVVHDVGGVNSDRQLLGLAEPERLRNVRIKKDLSPGIQLAPSKRSVLPGLGIHQHIDSRGPVWQQERTGCSGVNAHGQRVEGAESRQ